MTNVRCSVDTCKFWGEGEVCKADAVWVKNNMTNDTDDELYQTEFADEPGIKPDENKKSTSAGTSSQTCCETMRPHEKHNQNKGKRGSHCCG